MRSWLVFGLLFAIGCAQEYNPPIDNYLPPLKHNGGIVILPNHQFSLDYPDRYTSVCDKTIVRDQGDVGTCTAFGVSSVLSHHVGFPVSALWLFNASVYKAPDGKGYIHPGDTELTVITAMSRYPVADSELPYDIKKGYWFLKKPPQKDSRSAVIRGYLEVPYDRIDYIKLSLYREGPMVVEMYITEDIYDLKVGQFVKHLDQSKRAHGFGHVLTLCGYTKSYFILENSWGRDWGHRGFMLISYDEWMNRRPNVIQLIRANRH